MVIKELENIRKTQSEAKRLQQAEFGEELWCKLYALRLFWRFLDVSKKVREILELSFRSNLSWPHTLNASCSNENN